MAKKVLVKIHLLIKVNTEKTPTNRLCCLLYTSDAADE